ncbi:MAG: epimerase, partial [Solirubrobacterales bacterium]|nr:epimerase [Solirubrobacterales bacterium]
DLVAEITRQTDAGRVTYVARSEDPRDYKVDCAKIGAVLGFVPQMTVADGIRELTGALAAGAYPEPWDRRYRNTD